MGAFMRLSWNDGYDESWAFAEIDRSLAVGATQDRRPGRRPLDVIGVAIVVDTLSAWHKEYLEGNGYGFIIGDGALNYGPEIIGDTTTRCCTARRSRSRPSISRSLTRPTTATWGPLRCSPGVSTWPLTKPMSSPLPASVLLFAFLAVSARSSHQDSDSENIGDCAQGGSSDLDLKLPSRSEGSPCPMRSKQEPQSFAANSKLVADGRNSAVAKIYLEQVFRRIKTGNLFVGSRIHDIGWLI